MIINGKEIANEILAGLKDQLQKKRLDLKLVAVLAGGNAGLKRFVKLKEEAANSVGIKFKLEEFSETVSFKDLAEAMKKLVADESNSGIFIFLPLPAHIDSRKILNLIPSQKDPDMLSEKSRTLFEEGKSRISPPTVEVVKIILERYGINPAGKRVAIFGKGFLVGQPLKHWFSAVGAEVFAIDEYTENPADFSIKADIIVSGVGKPRLIKADMVKDGATVFNFGYASENGRITGDVDFESVAPKAGLITPVPGGIGPIVIVSLLKNLIILNS